MKDDPGLYAVFTEQGSSASHMTATKVLDDLSRLPGCAGQASDAVSAYTRVKTEEAPKLVNKGGNDAADTLASAAAAHQDAPQALTEAAIGRQRTAMVTHSFASELLF